MVNNFNKRNTCFRCGVLRPARPTRRRVGHVHSEEYIQMIPQLLRDWGVDDELWAQIKNKNALRRLAKDGDEEHGLRRVASLRARLASEEGKGEQQT